MSPHDAAGCAGGDFATMAAPPREPLLSVRGLTMHFPVTRGLLSRRRGIVHAVDGVDLDVAPGETLGLVGESGCGKSTLGRCLVRLHKPTAGRILFRGRDLAILPTRDLRPVRRHVQIIFQDPYASLNPRMTVEEIIGEPLRVHRAGGRQWIRGRVQDLLQLVGLDPRFIRRYPHEFSGGQRQRIGIARALALEPELVVADEPISALDVSIQAQILNLMMALQERLGLAFLFISHDLSAVRHVSDRIAVMYLGKIVEMAAAGRLYEEPLHPYTAALVSVAPGLRAPAAESAPGLRAPDAGLAPGMEDDPAPGIKAAAARPPREPVFLAGEVPSPLEPPPGCRFHTRCPMAREVCRAEEPPLREVRPHHSAACHFAEEVPLTMGIAG